ncbi:MAG: hypothetical protein IJ545_08400 [Alphaproteobacteria bacterium]|nr:hypothetical protein [Alphaproteobacteria bacterium]
MSFEIALTVSKGKNIGLDGNAKSGNFLEVLGISVGITGEVEENNENKHIQKLSFAVHYLPNLLEPKENIVKEK